MANFPAIQLGYAYTGNTIYATLRNAAGQYWDVAGAAYETLDPGSWGDYDIAMTETPAGSAQFVAAVPAALTSGATVYVDVRKQAGGAVAIGDPRLADGEWYWDGTAIVEIAADVVKLAGGAQSATDLKDFADDGYDPSTNKVQGVVLVDTTTTNTDMRGTDGANTTVPDAAGVAATPDDVLDAITIVQTTAAGGSTALLVTLASGVATDGMYQGHVVAVQDADDSHWEVRRVNSDEAAWGVISLDRALSFTPDVGDVVRIYATGYADVKATHLESTAAKAAINAEVLDVLNVDTFTEPGQGAPTATPTFRQMVHYLYKNWRNKKTQTATTSTLFADDATTPDQVATVSDDGTTATKGEMGTGA